MAGAVALVLLVDDAPELLLTVDPGAVLVTEVIPDGFLVAVLPEPPLIAEPPAEVVVEPFLTAAVPPVLVAVVLRVEAVLDMVPELLPEIPFTVEPPLSDVLPANTLSDPVRYLWPLSGLCCCAGPPGLS